MKKFLSISLVVAMVLALGSLAMASELGGITEAEIPVVANIGPFARVTFLKAVNFGELSGPGNYTTTGLGIHPGRFEVEANTDVQIELKVEDAEWIASPYKFTISRAPGSQFKGKIEKNQAQCSFMQSYVNQAVGYTVAGELWIETISQVESGDYGTKIVVTVSQ